MQVPYHQVSYHFRKFCAHSSTLINASFLSYIPIPYFGFFFSPFNLTKNGLCKGGRTWWQVEMYVNDIHIDLVMF